MSVALLITGLPDPPRRLVPITAQARFVAHWLPGARALGLGWVELFEAGHPVGPDDRQAVLGELARLRDWMAQQPGAPGELERLDRLATELRAVVYAPGVEVFVG